MLLGNEPSSETMLTKLSQTGTLMAIYPTTVDINTISSQLSTPDMTNIYIYIYIGVCIISSRFCNLYVAKSVAGDRNCTRACLGLLIVKTYMVTIVLLYRELKRYYSDRWTRCTTILICCEGTEVCLYFHVVTLSSPGTGNQSTHEHMELPSSCNNSLAASDLVALGAWAPVVIPLTIYVRVNQGVAL